MPKQLPPEGDWTTWLLMGGRGSGKTRAGAEWVHALALARPESRIALVQAMWPTFPGTTGARAVRMRPDGTLMRER